MRGVIEATRRGVSAEGTRLEVKLPREVRGASGVDSRFCKDSPFILLLAEAGVAGLAAPVSPREPPLGGREEAGDNDRGVASAPFDGPRGVARLSAGELVAGASSNLAIPGNTDCWIALPPASLGVPGDAPGLSPLSWRLGIVPPAVSRRRSAYCSMLGGSA